MGTVLVTGASGVVGRAVLERLRGRHRVVGLVHADTGPLEVDERHVADLRQERLGLGEETWVRLTREVDAVVHSGALTEWGRPESDYEAINVAGTARVADLASAARAPVHYVGTAFSQAIALGRGARLSPDNVVKPYVTSKLKAERVLVERGVPHSIFRPTNLLGDSRTGAAHRPQIVQVLSDWICRGRAPYLPVHPGNLVDVVPLDTLALALAAAVGSGDVGDTYWVTAGAAAPTIDEVLDLLLAHAAERGREIGRPPVIDPSLRRPRPEARPTARAFLKVLDDVSGVTHECGGVLPSSMTELEGRFGVPRPDCLDAYRRSLEYWARERESARTVVG